MRNGNAIYTETELMEILITRATWRRWQTQPNRADLVDLILSYQVRSYNKNRTYYLLNKEDLEYLKKEVSRVKGVH